MLVIEPTKRASMSELRVHAWMMKGYSSPIDNHVPKRKPLGLPLDKKVIEGMQGFEFGTSEQIQKELEEIISKEEYQIAARKLSLNDKYIKHSSGLFKQQKSYVCAMDDPQSIPAAYHPLISIYHLVKERMEHVNAAAALSTNNKSLHRLSPPIGFSYTANGRSKIHHNNTTTYDESTSSELSPRSSLNESDQMSSGIPATTTTTKTRTLSKRINQLIRRATMHQDQKKKDNTNHDPYYRNSMPNNQPKSRDYSLNSANNSSNQVITNPSHHKNVGHAHPIYLKGLFSVSTTSNKKASDIRYEIIRVLIQKSDIEYRENNDRFECCMSIDAHTGIDFFGIDQEEKNDNYKRTDPFCVRFDIYIVKIPWLLGMRGIQFRKVSGDTWQYKNTCTRILQDLRL